MTALLEPGDVFTIEGRFRPRTFWQWLTGQPRELQRYVIPFPENISHYDTQKVGEVGRPS